MRIAIVAQTFRPTKGGIPEYTQRLAEHLSIRGDDVTILTPSPSLFDTRPYAVLPIDLRPRGTRSPRRRWQRMLRTIQRHIKAFRVLNRYVRQHRPDVVLLDRLSEAATAVLLIRLRRRIPYGVVVHGQEVTRPLRLATPNLYRRYAQRLRLLGLRRADLLICNSAFMADTVQGLGVDPSRIVVLRPAVDLPKGHAASSQRWPADRRIILAVCRLVKRKGLDQAIRAMRRVRLAIPGALFVIAGRGPDRDRLGAIVDEEGVQDSVLFLGEVSDQEKASLYHASEVFLMPNRQLRDGNVEGFGIVFLEAASYAKPAIGGRSGGVPEAIVDGETGLLVDPDELEEVERAVISVMSDASYARRLGQEARRRVAEWPWSDELERTRNKLEQVRTARRRA